MAWAVPSRAMASNVIAAHIHQGVPGANGPVVAFLYGAVAAGAGPFTGLLVCAHVAERCARH